MKRNIYNLSYIVVFCLSTTHIFGLEKIKGVFTKKPMELPEITSIDEKTAENVKNKIQELGSKVNSIVKQSKRVNLAGSPQESSVFAIKVVLQTPPSPLMDLKENLEMLAKIADKYAPELKDKFYLLDDIVGKLLSDVNSFYLKTIKPQQKGDEVTISKIKASSVDEFVASINSKANSILSVIEQLKKTNIKNILTQLKIQLNSNKAAIRTELIKIAESLVTLINDLTQNAEQLKSFIRASKSFMKLTY